MLRETVPLSAADVATLLAHNGARLRALRAAHAGCRVALDSHADGAGAARAEARSAAELQRLCAALRAELGA